MSAAVLYQVLGVCGYRLAGCSWSSVCFAPVVQRQPATQTKPPGLPGELGENSPRARRGVGGRCYNRGDCEFGSVPGSAHLGNVGSTPR